MKKNNSISKSVEFLFEVGTLRKIIRAHRQSLLTDDFSDNIASHSFRVAWIGWILAKLEKVDPYKVLLMCLAHDTGETRSGDQNWIHKKYLKVFEDEIINDQIKGLPDQKELISFLLEYTERKSKESIIAKDADLIDQILLLKEYVVIGNKEAEKWLGGKTKNKSTHLQMLKTKSAKRLGKKILESNPTDWWKNIWTSQRR